LVKLIDKITDNRYIWRWDSKFVKVRYYSDDT